MVAFVAAFDELLALAGGVGDHQPAAVQHADELLQLFGADRLRREVALETLGDFVEARLAVEHLQDRVLFFFEAVVLQPDGILHDPIDPALVALLLALQIGPLADRQLARRAGDKAVGECGHREGLGEEDKETRRGGDKEICVSTSLLVSLSPPLLVWFVTVLG